MDILYRYQWDESFYNLIISLIMLFARCKNWVVYSLYNSLFFVGYALALFVSIPITSFVVTFGLPNYLIMRTWTMMLAFITKLLRITIEVRNESNIIDNSRAAIMILNHQDVLDGPVHHYLCYKYFLDLTMLVKKKSAPFWPVNRIARDICRLTLINNDGTVDEQMRTDMANMIEAAKDQKMKILFYPEGTRNNNDKLLPFKKGAFKIAIENELPIMAVVISPYNFVDRRRKIFTKGKIIVDILKPISTKGLTLDDMDQLMKTTHDSMSEKYAELRSETFLNG